MIRNPFILVCVLLVLTGRAMAQSAGGPVEHMSLLSEREDLLRKNYLSYMSEVAHGARARKMEKRRNELITSVQNAIRETGRVKGYKGDISLRNAFIQYWNVLLHVLKEDYHKIVDMEEVAEQSYDMMEAYMLAQEKADEKLDQAYESVAQTYSLFASTHGVKLTEGQQSKLNRKLEKVGNVNKYMSEVFLIVFKSQVQENNIIKSLNEKNVSGVEQGKNALQKYSQEGLMRLDTLKPYSGDASLINASRKVLEFYRVEAETKIPTLSAFLIKAAEFDKLKKSFDTKPANKRTKQDVDEFNTAVNDLNKQVGTFNKVNDEINVSREKVLTNWSQARKRFMDQHMPYK
jgi:hypothetical protein